MLSGAKRSGRSSADREIGWYWVKFHPHWADSTVKRLWVVAFCDPHTYPGQPGRPWVLPASELSVADFYFAEIGPYLGNAPFAEHGPPFQAEMAQAQDGRWVLIWDQTISEWVKARWTPPGQYEPDGFWLVDDFNAGESVVGVSVKDALAWHELPNSPA